MAVHLSTIPIIFDRQRSDSTWEPLLLSAEQETAIGVPQLASNWRMDHRVSVDRERELATAFSPAKRTLTGLANDHHLMRQCQPVSAMPGPAYGNLLNNYNRLPSNEMAPGVMLLHMVSLNRLLRFALRRAAYGLGDLEAYLLDRFGLLVPSDTTDKLAFNNLCDQLALALNTTGQLECQDFSGRLADALGPNEPHWWAAPAYDVDPLIAGEDWSAAAYLLGQGHLGIGEWMLAWRYPADVAAPLYRPSVLEAQDSGFHHPSPPNCATGLTMSLVRSDISVREMIHRPLKDQDAETYSLGRLGRLNSGYGPTVATPTTVAEWFDRQRGSHRRLLADMYPQVSAQNWLTRHGHRA